MITWEENWRSRQISVCEIYILSKHNRVILKISVKETLDVDSTFTTLKKLLIVLKISIRLLVSKKGCCEHKVKWIKTQFYPERRGSKGQEKNGQFIRGQLQF